MRVVLISREPRQGCALPSRDILSNCETALAVPERRQVLRRGQSACVRGGPLGVCSARNAGPHGSLGPTSKREAMVLKARTAAATPDLAPAPRGGEQRNLLATFHRPEVVLGMLVAVLHLDIVTPYSRFARQLCVSLVIVLGAARAFLAVVVVWRASRTGRSSLRSLAVSDFIHGLISRLCARRLAE